MQKKKGPGPLRGRAARRRGAARRRRRRGRHCQARPEPEFQGRLQVNGEPPVGSGPGRPGLRAARKSVWPGAAGTRGAATVTVASLVAVAGPGVTVQDRDRDLAGAP